MQFLKNIDKFIDVTEKKNVVYWLVIFAKMASADIEFGNLVDSNSAYKIQLLLNSTLEN